LESVRKTMSNIKQWIILRKDLKMRKGKMISQGAHASMAAILKNSWIQDLSPIGGSTALVLEMTNPDVEAWITGSFTKICLGVQSEKELLEVYEKALVANLLCALITDEGKTEFGGVATNTAVSVGPCSADKVKDIVGHLKLL